MRSRRLRRRKSTNTRRPAKNRRQTHVAAETERLWPGAVYPHTQWGGVVDLMKDGEAEWVNWSVLRQPDGAVHIVRCEHCGQRFEQLALCDEATDDEAKASAQLIVDRALGWARDHRSCVRWAAPTPVEAIPPRALAAVELSRAWCRSAIEDGCETLMHLHYILPSDRMAVLPISVPSPEHKNMRLALAHADGRRVAAEYGRPVAVAAAVLAWAVLGGWQPDGPPPSEHPDRVEVLSLNISDGETTWAEMWEVVADPTTGMRRLAEAPTIPLGTLNGAWNKFVDGALAQPVSKSVTSET